MAEARTLSREYETVYVLKPDLEDAKIIEIEERLRGVVEQTGGKSIKIHNWGKKKLSFEKAKVQKGIYVHHVFLGQPAVVSEYERVLKFMDETLLYQTIRVAEGVDPNTRPVEKDMLSLPVRDGGRRDREHGEHRPPSESAAPRDGDAKTDAPPTAEAAAPAEAKAPTETAAPAETAAPTETAAPAEVEAAAPAAAAAEVKTPEAEAPPAEATATPEKTDKGSAEE